MVTIKQTEDKELLAEILKQLKENNHICPCSVRADPSKDKCMCEAFRAIINSNQIGSHECACGRYTVIITED